MKTAKQINAEAGVGGAEIRPEDIYENGRKVGYKQGCNDTNAVKDIINYEAGRKAGMKEVAGWLNNNLEPTVPMTLDYRKWHKQLKEWEIK